ncbi:hypothetical protein R1sor_020116 [Riccia sorocarpa]|uniref:Large ribosomal subunit protein mL43 n=1 Tax=Riccia sorocarpa TaxID=122646 RepID=A0ABD3IKQ1_9MARC
MAVRGIWQLKKLVLYLCDHSGSSRGAREFVESVLPKFKTDNPQLEVLTELHRGRHPHLKGYFANKNERVVDVKNLSSEEVSLQAMRLRNSTGRKVVKLKTRHVTFRPSVQGTWTPETKF